jgi:hypothetical protein
MSEVPPVPDATPPAPPAPTAASGSDEHPIGLVVTDDLRRSRLTVLFRILLAIPCLIWLSLWGIAAEIVLFIAWLIALVTGRVPEGLHGFLASFIRYTTHVNAYILLLANPFPGFANAHPYPIDAAIAAGEPQSRLTVLFRLLLAIPALILTYVFRLVINAIAFVSWFYCLFTGHMHEEMRNISAWLFKYEVQTYGYVFLLTGRYPSLSGGPAV